MKRKLLKERLKKLAGIITEQNASSVPQVVNPFNYLVPYTFDSYTGPNLTAQSSSPVNGWEIGAGYAGGPADDCNTKTNIGGIFTSTAAFFGEQNSVFYGILEYLWDAGDFNTEFVNVIYETTFINLSWLPTENGFWNSQSYNEVIGSIGLCYNAGNNTVYYYQRSKKLETPNGGNYYVTNIQDILDVIQDQDPNFDLSSLETFNDLAQALASFNITCDSGGCSGKCYCCCRNDGCLQGEDNDIYQEGCMDEDALNYDPDATFGNIEDLCEYPDAPPIYGCMDQDACNYNPNATIDISDYPDQLSEYQCQYRYTCYPGQGALAGQSFCDLDCENGIFNSLEECQKSGCEEERPTRPDRPKDPIKVKDPVKDTDIDPNFDEPRPDKPRPDKPLTPISGSDDSVDSSIDDTNVGLGPWFCPMDQGNFPWPGCCVQVGAPSVAAGFQQYPDDYVNANNQAIPNSILNATWPNNDGINYFSSAPDNATLFSNSFQCNYASGCADNLANPLTGANCGGFPSDYDDDAPIVDLPTINEPPTPLKQRLQELAGIKNKK
jgi:hypothetical protein